MTKPPTPEQPDPSVSESTPSVPEVETVVVRPDVDDVVSLSKLPEAKSSGSGSDEVGLTADEADFEDGAEDLGRPLPARAAPPVTPLPRRSAGEERNRARFLTFLRLLGGWALLGALAYVMWTPGEWQNSLLLWVALVILADEFGGWFGYLGLLLGGLGYFSPTPPPAQWLIVLPLVGGALMALLLVKHSGGVLVLPFAGLLFAGTLLAVARFGPKFDPTLKLPSDETFMRSALIAMVAGLAFSFVRQLVGLWLRRRAQQDTHVGLAA